MDQRIGSCHHARLRLGCRVMAAGLSLLTLLPAHAEQQALRHSALVRRPPLIESLEATQVSSNLALHAIYGLVQGVPTQPVHYPRRGQGNPTIYLDGLGPEVREVCVDLALAEGGYRASFIADIPRGHGSAAIPFDSSEEARRFITELGPRSSELAIHASPASHGKCQTAGPLLAASWSEPSAGTPSYLAVGAFGMGQPAIRVGDQDLHYCETLAHLLDRPDFGANVFGAYCALPPAPARCGHDETVKVLWIDGEVVSEQVSLTIRRGCSVP